MNHTYNHNPLLAAAVDAMSTIERCSKAARSMARQRAHLRNVRKSLGKSNAMARYYLALWAEERTIWAHLVGRTTKQEQQQ